VRQLNFLLFIWAAANDLLFKVGSVRSVKNIIGVVYVYYAQAKYFLLGLCAMHVIPCDPIKAEMNACVF
jgi:uncharacterized membrane protein YuzA (DUF378 family)